MYIVVASAEVRFLQESEDEGALQCLLVGAEKVKIPARDISFYRRGCSVAPVQHCNRARISCLQDSWRFLSVHERCDVVIGGQGRCVICVASHRSFVGERGLTLIGVLTKSDGKLYTSSVQTIVRRVVSSTKLETVRPMLTPDPHLPLHYRRSLNHPHL